MGFLDIFRKKEEKEPYVPFEAVKAGMRDYFVVEFEWANTLVKQAAIAEAAGVGLWIENGLYSGISAMFQTHQAAAIKNAVMSIL